MSYFIYIIISYLLHKNFKIHYIDILFYIRYNIKKIPVYINDTRYY